MRFAFIAAAPLAVALSGTAVHAATFSLATASIGPSSDGAPATLVSDPSESISPLIGPAPLGHVLEGSIHAEITAPPGVDMDIPNTYEASADIAIIGGPPVSGALTGIGPFSITEALASPALGFATGLIAAFEATPIGSGDIDVPLIAIPGLPAIGPFDDVYAEWDFSAITLTDTTIKGDFYIGLGPYIGDEVAEGLGLSELPPVVDFEADFEITATPIPVPAAAPLLVAAVAGLALVGRRRAAA